MRRLTERLGRDPGGTLAVIALLVAFALYAPTLGYGLVNLDDSWLVEDNTILANPSSSSVHAIWFDLSPETRFVLGAEYLPVRDVSIMVDRAIWGDAYGGYHLTNVLLYLAAIALWFMALVELGIARTIAGLAILLWALHPAHAESVAWISERKGLLGVVFTGGSVLAYARFRRRPSSRKALVVAIGAAMLAVWSKAPFVFTIAALAPIEWLAPAPRLSIRRSLVGLAVVGATAAIAFVPVLLVAEKMSVVATNTNAPASWFAMAVGIHGFYTVLAGMLVTNAVSYPISLLGPSIAQVVLGALALILALGAALAPRVGRFVVAQPIRIAAWIWLLGWFPVSRLVLPLRAILVADRYMLVATLGFALVIATGALALPRSRLRTLLISVVAIGAAVRSFDARTNWRDSVALWERATVANPADGDAWSGLAEALATRGEDEAAGRAIGDGLTHSKSPRLLLRAALYAIDHGDVATGRRLMQLAADGGEVRAMANLAVLLLGDGRVDDAHRYASSAVSTAPYYAKAHQVLARVDVRRGQSAEAIASYRRAVALAPNQSAWRCELGLVLAGASGHVAEARAILEGCVTSPEHGSEAQRVLARLPR